MDSFGLAFCWLTISYTDTVIESFCPSMTVLFWNEVILQQVSSMPTAADTAVDHEQQMQAILTTRTLFFFIISGMHFFSLYENNFMCKLPLGNNHS